MLLVYQKFKQTFFPHKFKNPLTNTVFLWKKSFIRLLFHTLIWTPGDSINKFYNFYMAVIVGTLVGVALETNCVIETNQID